MVVKDCLLFHLINTTQYNKDLNMSDEFIRRVTRVVSLNVNESDFTSTTYKNILRELYILHIIPELSSVLTMSNNVYRGLKSVDKDSLNAKINKLKNAPNFNNLYQTQVGGIGPGEIMLYLLVDDVVLSGSSKSYDITSGGKQYEVKSSRLTANGRLFNFKLGGTVSEIPNIIVKMKNLATALDIQFSGNEISRDKLKLIKEKAPDAYNVIETEFKKSAMKYFNHQVIFTGSPNGNSNENKNKVLAIKNVKENDISIEVITAGVIKPYINSGNT